MALQAGRLMLTEITSCTAQSTNFAFETTLAGLTVNEWIHYDNADSTPILLSSGVNE